MSNLQTRVGKLEQVTGINEPCEICEAVNKYTERIVALRKSLGIALRPVKSVRINVRCGWCCASHSCDVGEYTTTERALWERIKEADQSGTFCLPENRNLFDDLFAAIDRLAREDYGAHYNLYKELSDECNAKIQRVASRNVPRSIYLCRVPGCKCDYPKTEAEWHALWKGELAA